MTDRRPELPLFAPRRRPTRCWCLPGWSMNGSIARASRCSNGATGARVAKKDLTLVISVEGEDDRAVPLEEISELVLAGPVALTTPRRARAPAPRGADRLDVLGFLVPGLDRPAWAALGRQPHRPIRRSCRSSSPARLCARACRRQDPQPAHHAAPQLAPADPCAGAASCALPAG